MLSGPTLYMLATRHTLLPFEQKPLHAAAWNILGFGLPFFIALHWEYAEKITGASFSLTADHLSHLSTASKVAIVVGLTIAVAITALCIRKAYRLKILAPYLGSFAALVVTLIIITLALGPRYHVHIHHYFLTLCLVPFVRFRHPICLVTQAMLLGAYVEGASRWGLSPIWILSR